MDIIRLPFILTMTNVVIPFSVHKLNLLRCFCDYPQTTSLLADRYIETTTTEAMIIHMTAEKLKINHFCL